MFNKNVTGGFKKLKEDLAAMSWKEKLDHLWTYYKGSLVILLILAMIISIISSSCIARNTKTVIAGVAINVILSDEGRAYVKEGFMERATTGGREEIYFVESIMDDFTNSASMQDNYYSLTSLMALAVNQELDYMLVDETALKNLLGHDFYMDLREFFSEAELEALGENVVWLESGVEEEARVMPVAVKVEHIPFIAEHAMNVDDTYFAVVTNTARVDVCRDFWAYLNEWTPAA